MKIVFRNNELEDLANGIGDHKYPVGIGKKYRFVLHEISKMGSIKEILLKIGCIALVREITNHYE